MNDYSTKGALELEVADFGPIVEAKIDLRPLTVFIGPSNTGKSYLAILIYALHRHFSGGTGPNRAPHFWTYRKFRDRQAQLLSATTDALSGWAELTSADQPSNTGHIVLPGPIADEVRLEFAARGDALGSEIIRCFGIDEHRALVRKGKRDGARVVLRRCPNNAELFEHGLTIKAKRAEFSTTTAKGTSLQIDARDADESIEGFQRMVTGMIAAVDRADQTADLRASQLIGTLARFALPHLVGPLHRPAFYLPADRTGVMHAHRVVVSSLIERASMTGLRPSARTPMLSGVLADFLEQLIELDHPSYRRRRRPHRDLGTQIEKAILDGSVRVDRSKAIGYPHFTYRPNGWKDNLPLMNASSMVSELAPMVLYLRHMVGSGDVLIVEEPESHLHPAMQVELTRQLAKLIHSDIRVIITTHSEWLLEELANIVRRSKIPKAGRKEMAGGEAALRPDQVGAWLFQPKRRPRGSVVTEIDLDDSGLYPSGFDEVAVALHNNWAEISSRIGDVE